MRRSIHATTVVAVMAAVAVLLPAQARAQALGVPVAIDARVDAAFPIGDFADVAGTGVGFSLGASVGVIPGIGVYGNYSQVRFGGGWTGDDPADATDSGFALGVSAALPGVVELAPWVGAGLLFHQLEVRGTRSGVSQDMGFEVGGGVAIPVAGQWRLSPTVSYRHYGASIPAIAGLAARDLTVQYLTLGIGLNYAF